MRKSTLLSLIWLALLPAATPPADAATTIDSQPSSRPITLDGDPADWEGISVVYLEESLRTLAVTHDQDNLYLMYRFADDRLARNLLARGVILWVNSEGRTKNKDEAYGLRYGGSSQIERSFEEAPTPSQGSPPDDSQDNRRPPHPPGPERGRTRPDELTRIRFGVKEPVARTSDAEPAAASAAVEDGFCYELRIPIADIGGKVAAQAPVETRKIALGIQIGGLTEAEAEAMESAPPEMPGGGGAPPGGGGGARGGMGGMGGPGGGGPSMGGPPGGGPGGMKKRARAEIVWLTVVLEATPGAEGPI
jgi:hypothetical protein